MKTHYLILFILICGYNFAQTRLTLNNNVYMVIDNSAYVVVDDASTSAISTLGTGGNIVSEAENDRLKWNIGTGTGAYVVPFSNAAGTKIPLTVNIGTAGAGAGSIVFSTYGGPNWENDTYMPSDVLNMYSTSSTDNSAYVVDRFWMMDAINYTTKPSPTILFTYVDAEWSAVGNSINEGSLFAQRYKPAPTDTWFGFWGTTGTANTAANTVSSGTVAPADFTRSWTLVDDNHPLPIELAYFKGKCLNGDVLLEWSTATEINNLLFTIERSEDGITWEVIKTIPGAINSTATLYYSFKDIISTLNKDMFYYRLKQTDVDGKSKTSNNISVSCGEIIEGGQGVTVYPNPGHGKYMLSIQGFDDNVELAIYDVLGQKVLEIPSSSYSGKQFVQFSLEHLADAPYFLHVTSIGGFSKSIKIIKEN